MWYLVNFLARVNFILFGSDVCWYKPRYHKMKDMTKWSKKSHDALSFKILEIWAPLDYHQVSEQYKKWYTFKIGK